MQRLRELSASLKQFHERGWTRLTGAFSLDAAAAMREVIWHGLAEQGIARDDPATWTVERPAHLQSLRSNPVFRQVASPETLAAIDVILGTRAYPQPKDWGSLFIAFPAGRPWSLPTAGWHIDAKYTSALDPPRGVKTFALLGDVAPRSGATLAVSGSHRLVHRWFQEHAPAPGANSTAMREALLAHPYLRGLQSPGDPEARIARFMDQIEQHDGIGLQVVELSGSAVLLCGVEGPL